MQTREPYRFTAQVAASTTDQEYKRVIRADGVITELSFRIWEGSELALRLVPLIRDERGMERHIVQFSPDGYAYLAGNDEDKTFRPRLPVNKGDTLVVRATNTDGTNAYDFAVDITVDYAHFAKSYS